MNNVDKSYCILYKNKDMKNEYFSGYYEDFESTVELARKIKKNYDEVRIVEEIKITRTVRAFF